ncbi:MAG: tetratricopeptide repeat protein [Myxococcales bacterium]|nr:tetratricopeptide repeat protein [Myxococcales bacterium]
MPAAGQRRRQRALIRALSAILMAAPLLPSAVAAADDDWSLERDNSDPELVARRFAKLRKDPFDRGQWRALEKAIGRKGLVAKIEAAHRRDPEDVSLAVLMSRVDLAAGRPRDAADRLDAIEARAGGLRGRVFNMRMDALEAAGAHDLLVDALEKQATGSKAATARKLWLRALKAAERGGLDKAALRLAQKLAKADPRSLEAQERLANAATQAGDPAIANEAFEAAMKLARGEKARVPLRVDWARARAREGQHEAAQKILWDGLESRALGEADREQLYEALARAYAEAGQEAVYAEALEKYLRDPRTGNDAAGWRILAEARGRSGDDPIPAFRRAVELAPRDFEARKALILALEASGKADEALAEFRKLDGRAQNVQLGLELAGRMIPNGQRQTAMALGEELERMAGRDAQALMALVDFYNLNDEHARALEVARKLVASHPRDPDARIVLGEQLFQMHDEPAALREWAMLPKLIRPAHKGWARHAELLSEHNVRNAGESLKKALAAAPREPNYLRLQALIQTEQMVPHEALKTWQELLEIAKGPQHRLLREEARTRVVDILVSATTSRITRARDEAERKAFRTLSDRPTDAEAIEAGLFLAELYTREQRFRKAVKTLETLVEIEPKSPDRLAALALAQRRAFMADEAMTTVERLMDLDPKRGADLLSELSDLAFRSGDVGRVLEAANRAKASGADSSGALLRLGELYEHRGDTEAAARTYKGILEAHPGDASAMLHLAELQLTRGQLDEAAKMFRAVLDNNPPPDVARKAFVRALDLAEASGETLAVLGIALRYSQRAGGSNESLEFVLDALDRSSTGEVREWLGLAKQRARTGANSRLSGLRQSLLQTLARGPVGARERAATHLGRLALPDTAAPLARIGAHLSPPRNATRSVQQAFVRARTTALRAAGELDDADAIPVFVELLNSPERFSKVRHAAAWALARSSHRNAADALRPYVIRYDDSLLAAMACVALARGADSKVARRDLDHVSAVIRRVQSEAGRRACAFARAALLPDDRVDELIDSLDDADPFEAGIAAWRLGELDPARLDKARAAAIYEALFRLYIGTRGLTRDAAGAALARLLAPKRRATEPADLPPMAATNWEVTLDRWLRARIAPGYTAIEATALAPHRQALASALTAAGQGTRAERKAAAVVRETCANDRAEDGPRCLAPLIRGPVAIAGADAPATRKDR